MITEDYVSFEVAKLLKDKGFNEKVICYYDDGGSLNLNKFAEFQCCNQGYGSGVFASPTIQKAMKWLREVHNMYIVVKISHSMFHDIRWYFDIYTLEDNDLKILKEQGEWCKVDLYNSYEEAVEAAIKYCLENLI